MAKKQITRGRQIRTESHPKMCPSCSRNERMTFDKSYNVWECLACGYIEQPSVIGSGEELTIDKGPFSLLIMPSPEYDRRWFIISESSKIAFDVTAVVGSNADILSEVHRNMNAEVHTGRKYLHLPKRKFLMTLDWFHRVYQP